MENTVCGDVAFGLIVRSSSFDDKMGKHVILIEVICSVEEKNSKGRYITEAQTSSRT